MATGGSKAPLDTLLGKEMTRKEFLAFSALAIATVFGVVGLVKTLLSHAATPTASFEPESGAKTGGANTVSDAGASGGSAVKFTAASSLPTTGDLVTRCRFGAYASNEPYPVQPHFDLETATGGTKLPVASWFIAWPNSWMTDAANTLQAHGGGYDILCCWEATGVYFSDILNGSKDQYIKDFVNAASTYPGQVVIRLFHESNGNWYDWSPGHNGHVLDTNQWIQAWRHVVTVARSTGKTNVKFFWCMNGNDAGGPTMESLWPGQDYVDIVGVDAYNWGGGGTFDSILSDAYNRVTALDSVHDFWVGETGMDTQTNAAAAFYTSAYKSQSFPRLRTVCWFHTGNFAITLDSASLTVHKQQLPRMPQYGGLIPRP